MINSNDEDDILYKQWYCSPQWSQANKPRNLDEIERNPCGRYSFSPKDILKYLRYEWAVAQKLSTINQYRTGQLVLAASLELATDLYILQPGFYDLMTDMVFLADLWSHCFELPWYFVVLLCSQREEVP